MFDFLSEQEKIMFECREALHKDEMAKKANIDPMIEAQQNLKRYQNNSAFFEEFDPILYESKMRIDLMYYNQLLQNLDESKTRQIEPIISSLYKIINEIYEFVNIRPEIYGKKIDENILTESIDNTNTKLTNVIYDYIDRNFHSLTIQQRQNKYLEKSRETIKNLISEGVNPDTAIGFGIKMTLMEDLLKSIAFPFAPWSRINYLTENEDYGAVFDQDKLINLVESFERKIKNLAKVVAACI